LRPRGTVHARVWRVGAGERLARPAARLLRARVRAPGVARPRHVRTLCARRPRAWPLDRPDDAGAGRTMEFGRRRRMAAARMVGARERGAVSTRRSRAPRILE